MFVACRESVDCGMARAVRLRDGFGWRCVIRRKFLAILGGKEARSRPAEKVPRQDFWLKPRGWWV